MLGTHSRPRLGEGEALAPAVRRAPLLRRLLAQDAVQLREVVPRRQEAGLVLEDRVAVRVVSRSSAAGVRRTMLPDERANGLRPTVVNVAGRVAQQVLQQVVLHVAWLVVELMLRSERSVRVVHHREIVVAILAQRGSLLDQQGVDYALHPPRAEAMAEGFTAAGAGLSHLALMRVREARRGVATLRPQPAECERAGRQVRGGGRHAQARTWWHGARRGQVCEGRYIFHWETPWNGGKEEKLSLRKKYLHSLRT